MSELKHLLTPIKIRSVEIPNRVVMAPMSTRLGNPDGTVSDASVRYLERRAKGGPGLIITEFVAVHPSGLATKTQLRLFDERHVPGLRRLVRAAHAWGSKIAIQIHHAGRESGYLLAEGRAMGPSAIPSVVHKKAPREMTPEDIKEVVAAFGRAARLSREAGFDAVEVHGGHGYLLTQFLSALSNQRRDQYGGSLENRARFIIEVLREIRVQVGDDFPVSLRLSVEEFIERGYTPEDIQPVLPDFVEAGADIIHASLGTQGSPGGSTCASMEYASGFNAWRARKVKDVVDVPVIAVGRFTDPAVADEVIARGDADLVAFGRQFLADPDFLIKAREGRSDRIIKCLACNQGCIERLKLGEGDIRCAINPETGQETIYPKGPAKTGLNVWVVGSGPAGLTAGHEAARLGHKVSLFEKEGETGGQIRFACKPPNKSAYGEWIARLTSQVKERGVEIFARTYVTDAMIREGNPDAVIIATGGERIVPDIEGVDRPIVCDAWQVLGGLVPVRGHVVVIGGGLIGMETADFLCERGSRVTILEILEQSPVTTATAHGSMLHRRLKERNCSILLNTRVKGIEEGLVNITSDGVDKVLSPVEQVVLAMGLRPRDELKKTLKETGIPHFIIGDALEPRRILEATEEGASAAWHLPTHLS